MKDRAAAESRRAKLFGMSAALSCAFGIAIFTASLPVAAHSDTTELLAWTNGSQPFFTLPSSEGPEVILAAERGNFVLVHFFATWCEAWIEVLPALCRFADRSHGPITILAVLVAEPDVLVQRHFAKMPVNFRVLLDRDRAVAKAWAVSTLPTSFILDADLLPLLIAEKGVDFDNIQPTILIRRLSTKLRL